VATRRSSSSSTTHGRDMATRRLLRSPWCVLAWAYGAEQLRHDAGESAVSAIVSAFTPCTRYHFQPSPTNPDGATPGGDKDLQDGLRTTERSLYKASPWVFATIGAPCLLRVGRLAIVSADTEITRDAVGRTVAIGDGIPRWWAAQAFLPRDRSFSIHPDDRASRWQAPHKRADIPPRRRIALSPMAQMNPVADIGNQPTVPL